MHILAADDELLALEMLAEAIQDAAPDAKIDVFSKTTPLLEAAKNTRYDVAFLDIHLRGISGLDIAKKLREDQPNINIIFVTGFGEYAGEAIAMHASGYITKPVTAQKVDRELKDLRYPVAPAKALRIQCFGNFDAFTPDGVPIRFDRSKSKELLAYLVYLQGTSCTVREAAAILFENEEYDTRQRDYTQQIISALIRNLNRCGAEGVIIKQYNRIGIDVSKVDCDYFRFMQMDPGAINSYNGEFMSQYSWAEFTVGYLDRTRDRYNAQ